MANVAKLTQKALASALGISQQAIAKLVAAGMPDGTVAKAKAWRAKHVVSKANVVSIGEARLERAQLDVEARRLDLEERRGNLTPRNQAKAETFELARSYRDALQAWPARIAPIIAGQLGIDPDALRDALEAEVDRHLAELAEPRL